MRPKEIDGKYRRLQDDLEELKGVVVAFSGGVDSTLLLKVAKDVLGDNVLAVTAKSETTAGRERIAARKLASLLGVKHLVVASREFDLPEFVSNPPDRCYACKMSRFGDLINLAAEEGFDVVADGSNVDDDSDFRPGMRATRELGVRSPLREAGFSKAEIRFLSRKLDLPTWDKQSLACLASRIPYGMPITVDKLRQIDAVEERIRELLPRVQARVRHHGDTARIEVEPKALAKLTHIGVRSHIIQYCKHLGFTFVTIDLEGYRMGSLNTAVSTGR